MAILIQEVNVSREFNVMTTVMWPVKINGVNYAGDKKLHLFKNVHEETVHSIVEQSEIIKEGSHPVSFVIPGFRDNGEQKEMIITFLNRPSGKRAEISERFSDNNGYHFYMDMKDLQDLVDQLSIILNQPKMYDKIIG